MEQHALEFLEKNDLWNWLRIQASGKQGDNSKVQVPDHFWKQRGTCDEKLKENIESLEEDFVSAQKSFEALFRGLDPQNIDFKPVLDMVAEFFTHLGVA